MKIHVHWAILEDTCLLAYETFASFRMQYLYFSCNGVRNHQNAIKRKTMHHYIKWKDLNQSKILK